MAQAPARLFPSMIKSRQSTRQRRDFTQLANGARLAIKPRYMRVSTIAAMHDNARPIQRTLMTPGWSAGKTNGATASTSSMRNVAADQTLMYHLATMGPNLR